MLISLGTDLLHAGREANFDLDDLMRRNALVQASSGGGKSYLIRRLVEQVHRKVPVIIIDPEGEFSTLREKFNFVLVGPGGETPADPRTAEMVALRLLELRASAVCDIFELKVQQQHEWVKTFISTLISAPKKLWRSTLIVVDEAHKFMPENGKGESVAKGAMIDLATRGRKRGLGAIFATQRIAKLHKDGGAELKNLLVGPTYYSDDLERAAEDLGIPRKEREAWYLANKKERDAGTFEVLGRAFGQERRLIKVGPVQTSHPEAGKKFSGPPPAPSAIKALLPQLADLPKEVEEKATTVKDLQRRIRELEAEVRKKPAAAPPAAPSGKGDLAAAKAQIRSLRSWMEKLMKVVAKVSLIGFQDAGVGQKEMETILAGAAERIEKVAQANLAGRNKALEVLKREASALLKTIKDLGEETLEVSVEVEHQKPAIKTLTPTVYKTVKQVEKAFPGPAASAPTPRSGKVTGPQQKMLDTLAWLKWGGFEQPSRAQLAAAMSRAESGSFNNVLGMSRTAGLVDYPVEGHVRLTQAGEDLANPPSEKLTNSAMQARAMGALQPAFRKVLAALIERYPGAPPRSDLAEQLGRQESGSFNNILGRLRTMGFVLYPSEGLVQASPMLFPEG